MRIMCKVLIFSETDLQTFKQLLCSVNDYTVSNGWIGMYRFESLHTCVTKKLYEIPYTRMNLLLFASSIFIEKKDELEFAKYDYTKMSGEIKFLSISYRFWKTLCTLVYLTYL